MIHIDTQARVERQIFTIGRRLRERGPAAESAPRRAIRATRDTSQSGLIQRSRSASAIRNCGTAWCGPDRRGKIRLCRARIRREGNRSRESVRGKFGGGPATSEKENSGTPRLIRKVASAADELRAAFRQRGPRWGW